MPAYYYISCTTTDGTHLYLNPFQIVSVSADATNTRVKMSNGDAHYIKGDPRHFITSCAAFFNYGQPVNLSKLSEP
jgi:hypothetical protein